MELTVPWRTSEVAVRRGELAPGRRSRERTHAPLGARPLLHTRQDAVRNVDSSLVLEDGWSPV